MWVPGRTSRVCVLSLCDPSRPQHSALQRLEHPFCFHIDIKLPSNLPHSKVFSDKFSCHHRFEPKVVVAVNMYFWKHIWSISHIVVYMVFFLLTIYYKCFHAIKILFYNIIFNDYSVFYCIFIHTMKYSLDEHWICFHVFTITKPFCHELLYHSIFVYLHFFRAIPRGEINK